MTKQTYTVKQRTLTLPTGEKIRSKTAATWVLVLHHVERTGAAPFVAVRSYDLSGVQAHGEKLAGDWPAAALYLFAQESGEVVWSYSPAPVDEAAELRETGRAIHEALSSPEVLAKVEAKLSAKRARLAAAAEPEAPVDPLPVVEPEAPAAEPDTTTLPDPDAAPIKARTGHRVLDWIAAYPEAWPELAKNAATARRYKDRCAVLELTPVEAAQLRVAASQMVEQGQHVVPAKGVLRWLDAAGVAA